MIRPISWEKEGVVLIDQKALPKAERYVTCRKYGEVIAAINDLTVRGAPAVGIAAAMGIALGALAVSAESKEAFEKEINRICDEFSRTRPTAINLFWAIDRMKRCLEERLEENIGSIREALVEEARLILEEDIAANRRIGIFGRECIKDGDSILTHCNAGALATGGYGTALGIIRAAHEEGKTIHVFVDETRPVLQGARLTAWELQRENIPATLITDSMAGFVMSRGKVDLVIVGADRVAANGDVANKIGTYSLAVLAGENGIPFYVAAPLSTIDCEVKSGNDIPIEERAGDEVVAFGGVPIAPKGMKVYNPSFDVTPNSYISAIVTDAGVVRAPFQEGIAEIMSEKTESTGS
jgi:methylthioribose-1-phosphate isomerase